MTAPLIARILGAAFLLVGIAGFVPFVSSPAPFDAPVITLESSYRIVAHLFAVNAVHSGLHIFFGIWGLLAGIRFAWGLLYCRVVVWTYAVLVILGLIPITNTLFGVAPIYGHNVWLHAIIALFAAYGGYGRGRLEPEVPAV